MLEELNAKIDIEIEKIINKEDISLEELSILIGERMRKEQEVNSQKSRDYIKALSEMPF